MFYVKLNHICLLFIATIFIFGCNPKPIGNTLLSAAKSGTSTDTTVVDEGELDIQPDNSTITVNMDNSDRAEITGTCKDLDRKKNRIIVEVFPTDIETGVPYISNSLSDLCQTVDAGLAIGSKCFWVTKGIGLIEDAGLPSERTFPQCHNGRFGFSIKLGKILETGTVGVYNKYTIRFKLRTFEGILAETAFSRVTVDRDIDTPVIDSVVPDQTNFACDIKTSPARFNSDILYTLNRTFKDALSAGVSLGPLFASKSTASVLTNDSVFSWKDDNFAATHAPASVKRVIAGVTYSYTLTAVDNNYAYASAPTKTSNTVSCTMDRSTIRALGPPVGTTCFTAMDGLTNPFLTDTEWGRSSVNANWVGANGEGTAFTFAKCNLSFLPFGCTEGGLVVGTNYFYAVREVDPGTGQKGRWSKVVIQCKP